MFDTILLAVGAFVLIAGLLSEWLEKRGLPPSVLALLAGIILGPAVLGIFDPNATGHRAHLLEVTTRLSLGIGITSLILFLPKKFPRKCWGQMLILVAGGTLLMWAVSTALVHSILGVPLYVAAVMGAALAPTDPVAARPIVEGTPAGKHLPHRLRHALALESSSNDAAGYIVVFLPFLLLTLPAGAAVSHFFVHTLLWEVVAAALLGVGFGYACGHLLHVAERRHMIKHEYRLVYTAAMTLVSLGGGRLLQMSELIVAVAAALTFAQIVASTDRKDEEHGQEAANRFLSVPIFGLVGTALPFSGWHELGWRGALLAVAILLFRRIPAMFLLCRFLPMLQRPADALFIGWFGPIGVATVYYGALMEQRLGMPQIWDVVSLIICVSVVVHGLSATPLTRLYGRVTGQSRLNAEKLEQRKQRQQQQEDELLAARCDTRAREDENASAREGGQRARSTAAAGAAS